MLSTRKRFRDGLVVFAFLMPGSVGLALGPGTVNPAPQVQPPPQLPSAVQLVSETLDGLDFLLALDAEAILVAQLLETGSYHGLYDQALQTAPGVQAARERIHLEAENSLMLTLNGHRQAWLAAGGSVAAFATVANAALEVLEEVVDEVADDGLDGAFGED